MNVEIRNISEGEFEDFFRCFYIGVGSHASEENIRRTKDDGLQLNRTPSAFVNGKIVGTSCSVAREIAVPGGVLPTDAVRYVAVLPTHRRRGILTRMMRHQLGEIHARGSPLATLWASESGIYGRFGYGRACFAERWEIERQHTAIEHMPELNGEVAFLAPDEAKPVFAEVYDRVFPSRPGMFRRDENAWKQQLRDSESQQRGGLSAYFFAVYSRDGRTDGYVLYRINHTNNSVVVRELLSATDEAYAALWRFCFGVDLRIRTEADNRPVDDPLPWMLADPRRLQRTLGDSIWVRLVDVAAALEGRRYSRNDRLVIDVRDSFCDWNSARFDLDGGPDGARCRRTAKEADLVLSASDLASVYLGAVSFRTLHHAGRVVTEPEALRRADAMFATELQPWCGDHF